MAWMLLKIQQKTLGYKPKEIGNKRIFFFFPFYGRRQACLQVDVYVIYIYISAMLSKSKSYVESWEIGGIVDYRIES